MPKGVIPNPWPWEAQDIEERRIAIEVPYAEGTGELLGATVTRDPGCAYSTLIFGMPGEPTSYSIPVPEGTSEISREDLTGTGLTNLSQLLELQISAE